MFSGFIFLSSWLIRGDGFRRDNNIIMEIKEKDVEIGMENTKQERGEACPIKLQIITVPNNLNPVTKFTPIVHYFDIILQTASCFYDAYFSSEAETNFCIRFVCSFLIVFLYLFTWLNESCKHHYAVFHLYNVSSFHFLLLYLKTLAVCRHTASYDRMIRAFRTSKNLETKSYGVISGIYLKWPGETPITCSQDIRYLPEVTRRNPNHI